MNTKNKFFSKWDLLLIVFLVAGLGIWIGIKQFSPPAAKAIILLDGKVYKVIPLDKNAYYKIYRGDTYLMTVETKPGAIRATYSTNWIFPQTETTQVSVATGWISKEGETIISVPNKIVIYTEGSKERTLYDAMTYQN
ncbi:NusG domain II-containing protein [Athalassotoga sp.]|uniref:NusG domain II-containing protein n=1 Tax=Athalassotoga sp. TaxID=2022597 RepID=UPI003D023FED